MKLAIFAAALMIAVPLGAVQDQQEQPVDPGQELKSVELKPGLCAEYYNVSKEIKKFPDLTGMKPTVCRLDPQINFEMKDGWGFRDLSFREYFAVVWTGMLRVPQDGKVTFYLKSDDGSKLWVDGKLLIDNDGTHGMDEDSKAVELKAGDREFKVEYFQNKDKAGCLLSWKYEGIDKQVVPATAFWHKSNKDFDSEAK